VADDALHRAGVAEAPGLEGILQVHEFLGQLVEVEIGLAARVDAGPGLHHGGVALMRLGQVALQHRFGNGEAAPGQEAQRLVVDGGRLQRGLEEGVGVRPVRVRAHHEGVLGAQAELQEAVLVRLETGGGAERLAEG
jgi:hypothetical protein